MNGALSLQKNVLNTNDLAVKSSSKSQQRYLNISQNNQQTMQQLDQFGKQRNKLEFSDITINQKGDNNNNLKNLFNKHRGSNKDGNVLPSLSNRQEPNSGQMSSHRKKLNHMDYRYAKLNRDSIADRLDRYKNKNKKQQMTRESVIEFVSQEYGFVMTLMSATDAILFCRGPQLDSSEAYNEDKLVSWLEANLPSMRKIGDHFKPWKPSRTVPNSLNTSQDQLYLSKLSNGGRFDNNDITNQQVNKFQVNPTLIKEMNDCLAQCERQPALKRKIQDTLHTLQESMMDYKAQEGLKASMRAQKRLRDKILSEEETKERSIQRMLEQTAVLDSPIRAANLQEVLRKQWCEYRDSYVIMSKLTNKQKRKLNDMIK